MGVDVFFFFFLIFWILDFLFWLVFFKKKNRKDSKVFKRLKSIQKI